MIRNFERALTLVLKHEGGFVDHPKDPGGATNKGITIGTYRRYVKKNGTVADLKAITNAQIATVYRKQYWDAIKGDDLPDGVDYAVFDFAVNSGPARAAKYLQTVVGATPDGEIGPATLAAVKLKSRANIVEELCDRRMAFLRGLKTWLTFGKGWTRRVSDVEDEALRMIVNAKPVPSPVQPVSPPKAPEPAPKVEAKPVDAPVAKGWLQSLIDALLGRN